MREHNNSGSLEGGISANDTLDSLPPDKVINSMPPPMPSSVKTIFPTSFNRDIQDVVLSVASGNAKSSERPQSPLVTPDIKIVLLGDPAVGKTSLFFRIFRDEFTEMYKATIGVDFCLIDYQILSVPFRLQLWDTAGCERFKALTHAYYRGARIVLLAFDVTAIDPLRSLQTWHDEVLSMVQTHSASKPLFFVIGNKVDMFDDVTDSCSVSANYKAIKVEESVKAFCERIGAELWMTSAKARINIHELFDRVAAVGFNQYLPSMVCSNKCGVPQGSVWHRELNNTNSRNLADENTNRIKLKPDKLDCETKRASCCW